mgnify:CR=1 FL=1
MSETKETNYEFGLILPEKYKKGIYLFNQSVPTVVEGLNGTVPEKIRRLLLLWILKNSVSGENIIMISGTEKCCCRKVMQNHRFN